MDAKGPDLKPNVDWLERQKDYTIPVEAVDTTPMQPNSLAKSSRVFYACVGAALVATAYTVYTVPAVAVVAKTVFAGLTQAYAATSPMLVASAVTPIGVSVIAAVSLLAIYAIVRKTFLSVTLGFMTANRGGAPSLGEYFGDYGPLNELRDKIFKAVLPQRTWVSALNDNEVIEKYKQAHPEDTTASAETVKQCRTALYTEGMLKDSNKGLTLSQLTGVGSLKKEESKDAALSAPGFDVITELSTIQKSLGDNSFLSQRDISLFAKFIDKFGHADLFNFLHGINPKFTPYKRVEGGKQKDVKKVTGTAGMLKLDLQKTLGEIYLPTLLGTVDLDESDAPHAPKVALLRALFTPGMKAVLSNPEFQDDKFGAAFLRQVIENELDLTTLRDKDGNPVTPQDLEVFTSHAGILLFSWLYYSEQFDLVQKAGVTMEEINSAKQTLKDLFGTEEERAERFVNEVRASKVSSLYVQECPKLEATKLSKDFHVNFYDANHSGLKTFTNVFLSKAHWQNVQLIEHHFAKDPTKLVIALATEKRTRDKFLHVSIHGDSNDPTDGIARIREAMRIFAELQKQPGYENLTLSIGADANTKDSAAIEALQALCQELNLQITDFGATTIKIRAITTQQTKGGERVRTPGDHVIQSEMGTKGWRVIYRLLAGRAARAQEGVRLPNINYPVDHLTVQINLNKVISLWTFLKNKFTTETVKQVVLSSPVKSVDIKG